MYIVLWKLHFYFLTPSLVDRVLLCGRDHMILSAYREGGGFQLKSDILQIQNYLKLIDS